MACIVTLIVSVTTTAVVTFIITYIFCVKRKFECTCKQSTQEKVIYEQVKSPSSRPITKTELQLQPNPAYQTSHKVIMDTNPSYEKLQVKESMH